MLKSNRNRYHWWFVGLAILLLILITLKVTGRTSLAQAGTWTEITPTVAKEHIQRTFIGYPRLANYTKALHAEPPSSAHTAWEFKESATGNRAVVLLGGKKSEDFYILLELILPLPSKRPNEVVRTHFYQVLGRKNGKFLIFPTVPQGETGLANVRDPNELDGHDPFKEKFEPLLRDRFPLLDKAFSGWYKNLPLKDVR